MKKFLLILGVLVLTEISLSSDEYINNSFMIDALEAEFGIGAGAGAKTNNCILCHITSAGGPGSINASFGIDFQDASIGLSLGSGSGLSSAQLQQIFGNAAFGALDSDGDGQDNATELANNTDPASDISSGGGSSGSSSGGCGMIAPTNNNKTGGFPPALLAMLPLLALFVFRRKVTE